MKTKNKIIIFGCGGHAKSVANIIFENKKYIIDAFVGTNPKNKKIFNIPTIKESIFFKSKVKNKNFLIAIGDIDKRVNCYKNIIKKFPSAKFPSIIHPNTSISKDVNIGIGTVVMSNVTINISSKIGKFCIINTSTTIDHDCNLKDFVSLAPNVALAGTCTINKKTFIGIGSSIINNIKIGSSVIIGAGSLVIKDLLSSGTYVGRPAKLIKKNKN